MNHITVTTIIGKIALRVVENTRLQVFLGLSIFWKSLDDVIALYIEAVTNISWLRDETFVTDDSEEEEEEAEARDHFFLSFDVMDFKCYTDQENYHTQTYIFSCVHSEFCFQMACCYHGF